MTWTPLSVRKPDDQKFLVCWRDRHSGEYIYCVGYFAPYGAIEVASPWVISPNVDAWMPLPALNAKEWISSEEKLPPLGEETLVIYPPNIYDNSPCIEIATYRASDDWSADAELPYKSLGEKPTHWMPFPKMQQEVAV